MQRGYDDKGDGDGNGVRADLREGHKTVGKKRLNEVGEGRLADPAEGERRDGDAELGGCEVGVKMVDGSLERPGATLSLCHELCHPAAPDGDQGELGGDKEAICPTSRRIARSPVMSIQMLLAVGMVTSHRPGAVSAAFALPPD